MKVDSQEPTAGARQAKSSPDAERFKKALEESDARNTPPQPQRGTTRSPATARVRPTPQPLARASGPVLATQRGALSSPESLGLKRQAMHAEVQRLDTVRGEAQTQGQARTEHRLHEFIARELSKDLRAPLPTPPEPRPPQGPPPPDAQRPPQEPPGQDGSPQVSMGAAGASAHVEDTSPAPRAEAALALIERIEVFVKSQRPALSMSLRGHLDATVEVERTGPREVSLRIQGRHRPVAAEDLSRLRDALEARGLKLRSLRAE
ncbi:hypothetical protein [Corallococcus macrosporus]|uniref:Uncharacterized protein n=1 Tax=Myxococcus fulvus (strain ATCC BAA-855 / HW-1) TaxID=483219 RepID=F8CLH3_MYXFH|nr:hypothetical protein [Corallococcus macrosporus]AEI66497.1 hypothetical protein LILAB_23010 [Corallococcus macrosporus]